MTQLFASQAIGIFDSGIGGLTLAQAVNTLLPHEKIIYFGDAAHHPYGEKSPAAIQAYAIKICDFLLAKKVKLILIACHSASSAAYELAREYVASKAHVMNVIDPVINLLRENFTHKAVGLIGTRQTIQSDIYAHKIKKLQANIQLTSLATPLLAPLIEEGYAYHPVHHEILANVLADYLSHASLKNIDALLLGCTHYPLIKTHIKKYYDQNKAYLMKPELIDSADITARAVKGLLEHYHLLNSLNSHKNNIRHQFYVSDYSETFISSARFFFPDTVDFELYRLWE